MLVSFLAERSGLALTCAPGVYGSLYCQGHIATETHFGAVGEVSCQMGSVGAAFAPADLALYAVSAWVDEATYAGAMNWGNSYWRNA